MSVAVEDFNPFSLAPEPVEPVEGQEQEAAADDVEDLNFNPFSLATEDDEPEAEEEKEEPAEEEEEKDESKESEDESEKEEEEEAKTEETPKEEEVDETQPRKGDKPFMVGLRQDAGWARNFRKENAEIEPLLDEVVQLGKAWHSGDLEKILEAATEVSRKTTADFVNALLDAESANALARKYNVTPEILDARLSDKFTVDLPAELKEVWEAFPEDVQEAITSKLKLAEIAIKEAEAKDNELNQYKNYVLQSQIAEFDRGFIGEYHKMYEEAYDELAKELELSDEDRLSVLRASYALFQSNPSNKPFLDGYYNAKKEGEGKGLLKQKRATLLSAVGEAIKTELQVPSRKKAEVKKAEEPKKVKQKSPPVVDARAAAAPSKSSKVTESDYLKLPWKEREKILRAGIEARRQGRR